MDVFGIFNSINRYGRYFLVFVILANFVSVSSAQAENITAALSELCTAATTILAAAIIVLIIMAAVIYAIGQVMGAETRARASVWATAMLTGAIIGAVIYILTPYILSVLLAGTGAEIDATDPCNFGDGGDTIPSGITGVK